MTRGKLIVADFHGREADADALRRELEAAWPFGPAPSCTICSIEQIDPERAESADAVILTAPAPADRRRFLILLAMLDQTGVPSVIVGDPAEVRPLGNTGALVFSREGDPAVMAAAILGVVHRQREFRQVHQDLLLAHRFHGGLEGEIARMHEELQLAAMVQRELLPRELPDVCGIRFGTMWRPVNYVSGDIFDVARLDEDHVGVFIADAVGHGVPAALLTMVISRSLCLKEITGSSYRLLSPREVLSRLNAEMIRRQGRTTRFATAVYALINCRKRTCTIAGAGHPPPLLIRSGGAPEAIETPGGLLGIFQDEVFEQVVFELNVDDSLLFYSDGFEQAFPNPGTDLYESRLPNSRYFEEFRQVAQLGDPAAMVARIRDRLDSQRGSLHQMDDLTLICMKVAPLAQATAAEHHAPLKAGAATDVAHAAASATGFPQRGE